MFKSVIVAAILASAATISTAEQAAPVVVLVKVFATAGRGDELRALYLKRLEYLRKAEPDAVFRVHRSTKDPNIFLWYEVYPSQAAYENHVKVVMANFKKEAGPTPAGIIARPSESETFTEFGR
jgi:quinol monooxygenase YgiN